MTLASKNGYPPVDVRFPVFLMAPRVWKTPAKSECSGSGWPADFTKNIEDEKQGAKSKLSDGAGTAINAAEGIISGVQGEKVRGIPQFHEGDVADIFRTGCGE